MLAALAALVITLVACADERQRAGTDETTTTAGDGTATTTPNTTSSLPGGELVWCESPDGFVVGRPRAWHANDRCTQFHPEPFDVPDPPTDERVAAITAYIDPVPFVEVAAPEPRRDEERHLTTVDGLQAVRLAYEAGDEGLWPPGTPVTVYMVDLSTGTDDGEPATLFLDTIGLETFDYEENQRVLDRVARSVDVTLEGVPADPHVVARYGGGGGGYRVEGEITRDKACLRIPPHGDAVCTDIPERDQVLTIQLGDLEPVFAGVTGEGVFRVTAERRGAEPITVLPAPIGDSPVRGFAFTSDLDEIERLTLFDVSGAELDTIEPGG